MLLGIDLYPTPPDVIDQMLLDVEVADKVVLEPSAGFGNIVTVLKQRGAREVLACEIDPRLRSILENQCQIIADDFLKLKPEDVSHVDLIVMNPPFSAAEQHILHAYEIAPEGCLIVSLCNSETVRNPWKTNRGKIADLLQTVGCSEDLGACFRTAERKTDVEVSCLRFWKPKSGAFEFEDYFEPGLGPDDVGSDVQGIMPYDAVRDIVNRYVSAVSKFDHVNEVSREINQLTSAFDSCRIEFGARWKSREGAAINRAVFMKELQKAAWNTVFEKLDMSRYVTSKVREDINRYMERQQNVPFTMRNIYRMLEVVVKTNGERMKRTLLETFDRICLFSAENSTAGEKWKTNSDYMINRRFVVPGITDSSYLSKSNDVVHLNYRGYEKVDDIIKVLCYMTGRRYTDSMSLQRFVVHNTLDWGKWYTMNYKVTHESGQVEVLDGFFKIRGFKKGTMHFEFLDEEVWARFNMEVARIRGWQLPKTRTYKPRR